MSEPTDSVEALLDEAGQLEDGPARVVLVQEAVRLADAHGDLHPLQVAFIKHDGFQCGYCTPGQICSALAMAEELRRGDPSHVTVDLAAGPEGPTRYEIAERMSGNLCRCGAHNGIVSAIEEMLQGDRA